MAALSGIIFMTSLYCCLCLCVDCRHVQFLPLRSSEETFQPLCSKKCNYTAEEQATEFLPRYQCSCSRSCAVFRDCCYDSPYKSATSWQQFEFVCLSVVGRGRYRAVSSCPPNQRSDFCKDVLGHLPPVTSKVTNITYGNVFCASCNGDGENLVTWNVELRCSSENENGMADSSNDTTRIIHFLGEFWRLNEMDRSKRLCKYHVHYDDYRFLDGLELRPCSTVQKISECSASWRDLSVMKKCMSYEDPVYFHNTAYKNSHCAQCNYLKLQYSDCIPFYVRNMLQMELIDQNIIDFCKNRGLEDCVHSLSQMNKGRTYTLSDLLNVNQKECSPPEGRRCCLGERYDFRTRRCRKVIRSEPEESQKE